MKTRVELMKEELARRKAASQPNTVVPANTQKVPVAERIGKGLAKSKKAVAHSATNVGDFIDTVATSYKFYSVDGVEQVPSEVIAAATKPTKRATARK